MHQISLQERLRGAIWGQFVGDAAALGGHFTDKPQDKIQAFEAPPSQHMHAHKQLGDFTYYGDAALVLLRSIVNHHSFSARDFGTHFVETFAAPDYPNAISKATHETIENYHLSLEEGHPDLGYDFQGGSNNAEIDNATRLAPLVAMYWDDPKLLSIVDKATRVTQNNEFAVAYMRSYARILRRIFQGEELRQAFYRETESTPQDSPIDHHIRLSIKKALDLEAFNINEAITQLGASSQLDQSFPAAIQAALKHSHDFKNAIIETMRAGGDSAGRAALVGTWLGAYLGLKAVPMEWRKRLTHYATIEQTTETLLNLKTHA